MAKKEKTYLLTLKFKTSMSQELIKLRFGIFFRPNGKNTLEEEIIMPEEVMEYRFYHLRVE